MRLEHSRGLRLAAAAAGESESVLERRLAKASIVVSLDPNSPGALATAATLLETLRRGPGRLYLDARELGADSTDAVLTGARRVARNEAVSMAPAPRDAVRIHVGPQAPRGEICGLPDGYGARLTQQGHTLPQRRAPNALGIMLTSALLAGESFKYLVPIRPARRRLLTDLSFCPVSLSADLTLAPELPADFAPDLGLIGLGAVGSAQARILGGFGSARLARALLVDPQIYELENLGTYSLGGYRDVELRTRKVDLAAGALSGWTLVPVAGTAEVARGGIDAGSLRWPTAVLSGLDSIPARYAAQAIWPSRLIDAATGDTAVGLHDVGPDGPCLRCMLPPGRLGESAAARLARELGLPIEVAMHGSRRLDDADLERLTPSTRERLGPHVGRPICGLADAIGLTGDSSETYRPSVPFVSQQAACLGVGRLIVQPVGWSGLPNFVQYDALIGPQSMTRQNRGVRPGCYCQQRAGTIRGGPREPIENASRVKIAKRPAGHVAQSQRSEAGGTGKRASLAGRRPGTMRTAGSSIRVSSARSPSSRVNSLAESAEGQRPRRRAYHTVPALQASTP